MLRYVRSRHPARARSRGQALVEFSFIVLPFFIIFFSTIEFALIMSSIGSYNFGVRDAARLGSLLGRTSATADSSILQVITNHVSGLVMAKTQEVDIYRATSDGQCLTVVAPGTGAGVSVDSGSCLKNEYDASGALLNPVGGVAPWPPNVRDDSLQSADYLGVRVLYRYTYLTGFIAGVGTPLNLSSTSVQRIEPQDFQGMHSAQDALAWMRPSTAGSGSNQPRGFAFAPELTAVLPETRGGCACRVAS
jgi:hypothetical protein